MVDCENCINRINKGSYWECKLGLDVVKNAYKSCDLKVSKIKNNEGKKYDNGKNRMGLMCENFSRALWEVAKVSTFGANKYGANNWQHLENPKERYMDALCRHLFQHLQGEKINEESGLLHLSHCAWNILALLEFELKDDNMTCALKQSLDRVQEDMKVGGILKALKESEEENEKL